LTGFNITKILDTLSSKPVVRYMIYSSSTIFFFAFILIPPILGILLKWNLMGQVFEDPSLTSKAISAISASFLIAILVSVVDIVAGLPMAWLIVRGRTRLLSIIDTLADIPFIVPTVTLGYSLKLFWSGTEEITSPFGSSLVSPGWLLVILLHFTFSYPVVVRVLVGALQDYKYVYEEASRTLGAASFTAARTVTLPILKPSLIASFILAFARSLSETGATVMVAGTFENGPIFINNARAAGQEGPMVLVSLILILISATIFATIRILGPKLRMPVKRIWPNTERVLSKTGIATARNSISTAIFLILVLIPSLFVAFPAVSAIASGTLNDVFIGAGVWQGYWQSLGLSYFIGATVTFLNVVVGLPMAILIARKRVGRVLPAILDSLVNVPLIIPSIALGASMRIFWGNFPFIPEIGLLIFAHLSITYPYFVRAMAAAIERIDIDLENASRILGARPFTVFRTIILPMTKYSLFAGAVMMLARSIDETGATLAVTTLKTAPVLLVDWVKGNVLATPLEIGLGCAFLIIFSFIVLLVLRLIVRGKGRY